MFFVDYMKTSVMWNRLFRTVLKKKNNMQFYDPFCFVKIINILHILQEVCTQYVVRHELVCALISSLGRKCLLCVDGIRVLAGNMWQPSPENFDISEFDLNSGQLNIQWSRNVSCVCLVLVLSLSLETIHWNVTKEFFRSSRIRTLYNQNSSITVLIIEQHYFLVTI